MLSTLRDPIPPMVVASLSFALVAAMAIYCLAYNFALGRPETLENAISWPLVNLVPFVVCLEVAKRMSSWFGRMVAVLIAVLISLALDSFLAGPFDLAFEVVRRVPAAMAVLFLLLVALNPARQQSMLGFQALPVDLAIIDWIEAAGNYVILHGGGCKVMHRATLSALEDCLSGQGFVRIHRSRLVRRSAIASIRSNDVLLHDGKSLLTGARYRSALEG